MLYINEIIFIVVGIFLYANANQFAQKNNSKFFGNAKYLKIISGVLIICGVALLLIKIFFKEKETIIYREKPYQETSK